MQMTYLQSNSVGRPRFEKVFAWTRRHPLLSAISIFVAFVLISAASGLLAKSLLPQYEPDFVALCALSAIVAVVLGVLGVGRAVGFNVPAHWRDARLLIFPILVVGVLPFVTGLKPSDGGTFVYLLIAYALTGFMEETVMRGLVMWVLVPLGSRKAIVISAILFGLIHIGNLLYRSPAIVFAQMIGALCDGVGLGALRIRSNTIWFPIVIHGIHDLALRYSYLPTIPLAVVQDTLLLGYGIYLMRKMRAQPTQLSNPTEAQA